MAAPNYTSQTCTLNGNGLCDTDLHIIEGIIPTVKLPYVPGHEMAGIVEAIGDGVSSTLLGQHAAIYIDVTDNTCRYCTSGRPNLCSKRSHLCYWIRTKRCMP